MSEWFVLHWYLVLGLALLAFGVVCVWRAICADSKGEVASWLSDLLIWPAIFRQDRGGTSRKFIVVGLVVMLLLVILSVWINPDVR